MIRKLTSITEMGNRLAKYKYIYRYKKVYAYVSACWVQIFLQITLGFKIITLEGHALENTLSP